MIRSKVLIAAFLLVPHAAFAEDASGIKIELQASMQRHIDRGLIDGQMLSVNFEDGSIKGYFPTKVHSDVLKGDGYFVMCSEVVDAEGQSIDVDYYLARGERGFKVFKTAINNRAPLIALINAGEVKRF